MIDLFDPILVKKAAEEEEAYKDKLFSPKDFHSNGEYPVTQTYSIL